MAELHAKEAPDRVRELEAWGAMFDRTKDGRIRTYAPPPGYSDSVDHFVSFFEGMRSRKPVVEDAVFGFRAAGAALLLNRSYFDNQTYGWNAETMSAVKDRPA